MRITPSHVFLQYPEMPYAINLKLSDFKDTLLRHILKVIPVHHSLSCYHGNRITKGTSKNLARKESEILNNSVIYEDIEIKFVIETNFGPLSSESNIQLQFDIIMTCFFLLFKLFR